MARKAQATKQAPEVDKLENARSQGQAQFDSIMEMVEALRKATKEGEDADRNRDQEDAERTIHEDALKRSGAL